MLTKAVNGISTLANIIINKSKKGFACGSIMSPEGNKKIKFWLSWGDDYVHLRIRKDNLELLDCISKEIGKPHIKCVFRGWFGREILYSWEKDFKRREAMFKSMQVAIAMKSGLFSFLGWQDVQSLET